MKVVKSKNMYGVLKVKVRQLSESGFLQASLIISRGSTCGSLWESVKLKLLCKKHAGLHVLKEEIIFLKKMC